MRGMAFSRHAWERLWDQPRFTIYTGSFQMLAGALEGPFPVFSRREREGSLMFIRDGIRVLHGHWLVDRKREAGTMRVGMTRF